MQIVSFRTISSVSCTRNSMGKMVRRLSCITIKKNNFDVKILKIDRSIFEKMIHEKFNNCIILGFSHLNNQITRTKYNSTQVVASTHRQKSFPIHGHLRSLHESLKFLIFCIAARSYGGQNIP